MTLDPGRAEGGDYDLSNPIHSFIEVVRRLVFQPVIFFAELPRRGNFINPLVFALLCYEISAVLGGVLGLAGGEPDRGLEALVVSIIAAPIGGAIVLLILSGILHLLVRLIVGARESGFASTFRVASYASVVNLASWIPIIGSLVALVYGIYLFTVGIREMHETTTGKAALIGLIPVGMILLLALIGLFAAGTVLMHSPAPAR
ncbi:MAG: YIP1 family protein [Actinomycetota bacterium]|jgi:hypothetical protein|nr:YIP1 family protein [Actinomycetota bacterium]